MHFVCIRGVIAGCVPVSVIAVHMNNIDAGNLGDRVGVLERRLHTFGRGKVEAGLFLLTVECFCGMARFVG